MMGLYMIRPASQDVDKVKDKIQKSDYLCYKDLKEENDRWPSVNSVLDFCYFIVDRLIEYMTRLYHSVKHIMIFLRHM